MITEKLTAPEEPHLPSSSSLPVWFARLNPLLLIGSLLACLTIFLYHFYIVRKYSVNIPYWDDWVMFIGDHPSHLDWTWLHEQANDHRTVTAKLFVWLLFQINGWNLRTHLTLSFLIYNVCVAGLVLFARQMAPKLQLWVILGFAVFLLTPIIWIDFEIGYAVAVHFWLGFMLLAAYCLFREPQRWLVLLLGCIASILSIYSFAAGVATAAVTLAGYALYKGLRAYSTKAQRFRRRELFQLLMVIALIGGTLFAWLASWERSPGRLPWVLPNHRRFWSTFLNLISFSFGIERISSYWGLVCLLIVVTPACWLLLRKKTNLEAGQWVSLVLVAALLADLGLIALGRTEYGIVTSKFPHYAEHGMPLIILSVINWSLVLAFWPRIRIIFIAVLWVFCLMTFRSNLDFTIYQRIYAEKLEGRQCVKAYYEKGRFEGTGVDARCPTVFPFPVSMVGILESAKRQNPSFYRELIGGGN